MKTIFSLKAWSTEGNFNILEMLFPVQMRYLCTDAGNNIAYTVDFNLYLKMKHKMYIKQLICILNAFSNTVRIMNTG